MELLQFTLFQRVYPNKNYPYKYKAQTKSFIYEFLVNLGIGREITKGLVKAGAETYGISRTQSDLDSLKNEVGYNSVYIRIKQ